MGNIDVYNSKKVVLKYAKAEKIQKPEESLIQLLGDRLKNMTLLDLGVGGGRTTLHFGKLVKKYVGTDISKGLIEKCRERFSHLPFYRFEVCDAANLEIFDDNSFDIVLFSFNGIDYLDMLGREKCYSEVHRILKPQGYFFFSSHNILSFPRLFSIQKTYNPIKILGRVFRYILLHIINKNFKKLMKEGRAIINDGSWGYRLSTYYIHPNQQIQDLEKSGFGNVELFSIKTGEKTKPGYSFSEDDRIYYLCKKK